jgi:hypothetical protein
MAFTGNGTSASPLLSNGKPFTGSNNGLNYQNGIIQKTAINSTGSTPGGVPPLDLSALSGIIGKKTTTGSKTAAYAWDGSKAVPTTDLRDSYANLTDAQRMSLINFVVGQNKSPSYAKTFWTILVNGSTAAYQAGQKLSPWDIFSNDIKSPQASGIQGLTANKTVTQLSDSNAHALAYTALGDALGRIPTAEDFARTGLINDPNTGKPVIDPNTKQPATTERALQILAGSNPDFAETNEFVFDNATGLTKSVTRTAAQDPATYAATQVKSALAADIANGTVTPNASIQDQYASLAKTYGVNAYQPGTTTLTPQAQLDVAALQGGTKTLQDFKNQFIGKVLPNVASNAAPALQSGATDLASLADPAVQRISQLLEKPANTISLNDPLVQSYLRGDGNTFQSPAELDSAIKNDSSWQYTQNAKATYSDLAGQILTKMGFNA